MYRYDCFIKSSFQNKQNLGSLPPTENAAAEHAFRTYLQVQEWHGEKKDPCNWGWKATKNGLTPLTTLDSPAPENILKLIACKCKKGCSKTCGCPKNGLRCTILRQMCNQSCDNFQMEDTLQGEEEEGDIDEPEIMTFLDDN
ncbi:hypothetical protein BC332_34791 [Capsicum chinense]|nr:hypothetical protein BC332_34791 [Capsicum chinense]